jgi:peptidoglycan hydrolase CwlO-like protein
MPIFDENDKGIDDLEGLPDSSVRRGYVKEGNKKVPGLVKKAPILSIVLIVLVVSLGGVASLLATRLSNLSTEMNELKGIKAQLSSLQSGVDSSIDADLKARDGLKIEISRVQKEIDAMRTEQRHKAELARERQAAAEAKKKAPTANKPHQKEKGMNRPRAVLRVRGTSL